MSELVDRVKAILWIQDHQYDDYLNEVVPSLKEFAKEHCNNKFLVEDPENPDEYIEELPGPVVMFIARAVEYNINQAGLKSESLGDWSASYSQELPQSVIDLLKPYRKVRFND